MGRKIKEGKKKEGSGKKMPIFGCPGARRKNEEKATIDGGTQKTDVGGV